MDTATTTKSITLSLGILGDAQLVVYPIPLRTWDIGTILAEGWVGCIWICVVADRDVPLTVKSTPKIVDNKIIVAESYINALGITLENTND